MALLACALLGGPAMAADAAAARATPFKLGTFRASGREFLGLVLRDTAVLEIEAANAQYERTHATAPKLRFPATMTDLIARYDAELGPRLRTLAGEYAMAPIDVEHGLSRVSIEPSGGRDACAARDDSSRVCANTSRGTSCATSAGRPRRGAGSS